MERNKPGLWMAIAVGAAVLIVAISVPRRPSSHPSKPEIETTTSSGPTATVADRTVSTPPTVPPSAPRGESSSPGVAPSTVGSVAPATSPALPPAPAKVAVPAFESELPATRDSVRAALDNVQFALRDFRTAVGGNPVGTNAEITNALFGDNVKQVRVPMPDGSRVNDKGELCDPWGTPYFFHQQSAQKMEVRSAGPDLRMWTEDDLQM